MVKTTVFSLVLLALALNAKAETRVVRLESMERKIFQAVNREREDRGLKALKWNSKLGEAAAGHLAWMIARKTLGHRFAGEDALSERIAATGLRFNSSAENVAYATDWEDIHPGLMQSPGHRANILSPKYDEVGIAVALGPNGYYAVQNFAHTTSEVSSNDAEARVAKGLRREIKGDLTVTSSAKVREAMCAMADRDQLQASKLPGEPPLRRMFAYTATEPEEVPESLVDAAANSGTRRWVIGVCYKATPRYPGGTYWVGILY
ncbi:MAG TPA: CAP domain-containing protein [Terriglobales bacterium]|nr:CAP domain-containing protein [Terriglobales bacterium]